MTHPILVKTASPFTVFELLLENDNKRFLFLVNRKGPEAPMRFSLKDFFCNDEPDVGP